MSRKPPKKQICKCPPGLQKICKHRGGNNNDFQDIVAALQFEDEMKNFKRSKAPKLKIKKFKPLPIKQNYVPMAPPMEIRLRYISHCDPEPYKRVFDKHPRKDSMYDKFDFASSDEGSASKSDKKTRRRDEGPPLEITFPAPVPFVKHTESDKSILNMPSPKTSGEIVAAKRASVKPTELRPPLPGKSHHDLFKPHSGIVINADPDFVPDFVAVGGSGKNMQREPKNKKGKGYRCPKGGFCMNRKCKKKKCRKLAEMRRRQMARAARRGSQIDSTCWSMDAYSEARRAKSRSKRNRRFVRDDDIACGLDDIPKPDHPVIPSELKKGSFKTHSLTTLPCKKGQRPDIHYGILLGSCNMYSDRFGGRSRGRQALTMSVMAYCLAFHYHPKQWTTRLIDNLVDAGDQWYVQCADKVHDHSAYQGMCEVIPFGKKQVLLLNGKKMQVLLGEPEVVGYTMSTDPTVYNLCRGMKAFFECNRAGIMLTRILKVVIWKDKICYYIFDPAGRNSKAYSNYSSGTAALMNVKDLESVAEILLSRSVLEDQKFVLAPVKVLKMVDERCDEDLESERELTQAEKAMMSYRILNANTAIVNANMHLGDRCFEDAKYKQALPIAIAAMTYAKISPPNTWFSKTLDKILRLGNKLYAECSQPKVLIDLTVDNIPNEIMIGPYACEIIIYRDRTKGQLFTTKECILNIRTGLEDFFNHNYNAGILDFNNYKLAVWRQKDMFYLFDPYPRTHDGRRSLKTGKACCLMLLNTDTMADAFTTNWDFLPATTQFYIHAFKVLKLKKRLPKTQIVCTLSDDKLPGAKFKRKVLKEAAPGQGGDGKAVSHDIMNVQVQGDKNKRPVDEEYMGEIVSLVDSIQEDYVPPVPLKYKNLPPDPVEPRVVNLDSPTVSVTQVVPMWPRPRDKTNEPPEPDPDPEPTPPPTPPPLPPPEGGLEEEEADEEELDEEALKAKKEEEKRRKAEEEEARRKAEELPPPMPPPPPSPQLSIPEVPLAPELGAGGEGEGEEMPTMEPVQVERYVLLTEDARKRFKLRQIRQKMTTPLKEEDLEEEPSQEALKPSNFFTLPDMTQIIRGARAIPQEESVNILPFASIMAIVTSYKYSINTWTPGIVDFVIDAANRMYANKKEKFQLAPLHIIPKIGIGHQAFKANIDVVGEGATWQLEDVLKNKYLNKHDRGMITTSNYSCAFFKKNGLYYLFDGSTCNAMGLRDIKEGHGKDKDKNKDSHGKACFLRFESLHDLVCRILYNKDGIKDEQQFILSRVLVRRLLPEPRHKLPEDYDYATGKSKSKKSKTTIIDDHEKDSKKDKGKDKEEKTTTHEVSKLEVGYKNYNGIYRIEGTTSIEPPKKDDKKKSEEEKKEEEKKLVCSVQPCHFVCLVAMLMAAMHPLRTWNQMMVDTCIEKGLEIAEKANNMNTCEKRVIKNIVLDGRFMNVNIKKIIVVNENTERTLEQYMRAVLSRLRYVIVRFPQRSFVICQTDGFFHVFDPYPQPPENKSDDKKEIGISEDLEELEKLDKKDKKSKKAEDKPKQPDPVAGWTLYRSLDSVIARIRKTIILRVNDPEFYTFELTSVKTASRSAALNYKLSPLFKPARNPNQPFLVQRKPRPLVDEKMYWLNIEYLPWCQSNPTNDVGLPRYTPKTMWKDWNIEFPGDLYSLFGKKHPRNSSFDENYRGTQYMACNVVALVMTQSCGFAAWTGSFLDGIVLAGDEYHKTIIKKIGSSKNHEIVPEDFDGTSHDIYPFSFQVKVNKIIFGFVYNLNQDRFNLSKALAFFFEKGEDTTLGLLTCPVKSLAFGKVGSSYFMFDCQTFGLPVFDPGQGAAYVLKCESLNRLIYCITLTLNIKSHNQIFHLHEVKITLNDKGGAPHPKQEKEKAAEKKGKK